MAAGSLTAIGEKLSAFELASGQDACERLLSIDGLPLEVDRQTRRRMAELAPAFDAIAPATQFRPARIRLPGGWSLHGASIAHAPDGFRMLVQSANFTRHTDQSRTIHDAKGVSRGRSYWVELDAELDVRAVHAIFDHGLQPGDIAIPDSGLFHGRPFFHQNGWWIVCAIGDPEAGQIPISLLGRLDGVWLRDTSVLKRNVGPDPRWNPVVDTVDAAPRFMATVFPTVVWRMHGESRSVHPQTQHAAPLIARRLIGSSQLIPADGGYLSLAYERIALEDGRVQTVHRWLWFDDGWCLARLSRPFVLRQRGAEQAAGLTRRGEELVFSVVSDQGEIWLGSVPEPDVLPLLAPPLDLDVETVERQLESAPVSQPASLVTPRPRIPTRMKRGIRPTIASMTITGSNREIVGDALRSVVDWVDWCVLIDTGIQDDTIEIARQIAGDKLIVREFAWCDDFSAARNFALAAAADTGASWAVFVDSDERLVLNGVDIHAVLASSPELTLLVPHDSGEYTKDRFFRLPVVGGFRGPTHEAYYITREIGGGTVDDARRRFRGASQIPRTDATQGRARSRHARPLYQGKS